VHAHDLFAGLGPERGSDAARFVTGQSLYVDGALSAQLRSPEGAPSSREPSAPESDSGVEQYQPRPHPP